MEGTMEISKIVPYYASGESCKTKKRPCKVKNSILGKRGERAR